MYLTRLYLVIASAIRCCAAGPSNTRDTLLSPDPSLVKILNASFSGNGCPPDSVSTYFSSDRSRFTFSFDSFRVEIGTPGLPISARTKNCQLHLNMEKPDGWQYAVVESLWHGFAILEKNVTAAMVNTYYFSSSADAFVSLKFLLSGPQWAMGDVFTIRQYVNETDAIWSPCNSSSILNINNRVSLTSTYVNGHGELGVEDVSNVMETGIIWRAC